MSSAARNSTGVRRLRAPEVIQTSNMDCGPACLASVLEGFGLPVNVGRLREACQTDVDGTSIDTVEKVAQELGLEARQVLISIEQLAETPDRMLPAVLIVRLSDGANHFIVAWRRLGAWIQIMDPANGRRWVRLRRLLDDLYIHGVQAEAEAWREWAGSAAFTEPLVARLRALGLKRARADVVLERALEDPNWRGLAGLDAAERATRSIVSAGGARRGSEAARMLEALLEESQKAERARSAPSSVLPESAWAVHLDVANSDRGKEILRMSGAVLVRFEGRRVLSQDSSADGGAAPNKLSSILKAAIKEPCQKPIEALYQAAREDGWSVPITMLVTASIAALVVLVQALTFRALVDVQSVLVSPEQRMGALVFVFALLASSAAIDLPFLSLLLRWGRHLEARLRIAFQSKLPRLSDRYFQSRPISDMAERAHSIHRVRTLPSMVGQLLRLGFQLCFTTAALIWIAPASLPLAIALALISLLLPLWLQPWIVERELRARSLNGALARFNFDALLGLVPIHTHGAQRGLRREHEHMLTRWYDASLSLRRGLVTVEGLQLTLTTGLAAWLVVAHLMHAPQASSTLLLCYWALTLPALGRQFMSLWLALPAMRNATLRLLEPLGAVEEDSRSESAAPQTSRQAPVSESVTNVENLAESPVESGLRAAGTLAGPGFERRSTVPVAKDLIDDETAGVVLRMRKVAVRAGGHTLLSNLNLDVSAGEHVAILGPSGAGKSTLLALLLGWHEPAGGTVEVDGRQLRGNTLADLRDQTTWVDPGIQLWNRSMLDNLTYGRDGVDPHALGAALEQADLLDVLEGLPKGLDETLGEGGGLLSGGEGQRTRLGRAFARGSARLVLLDEPFRGIDRESRCTLLARTRERFADATLLCVTHDVEETRDFDRVLVVEGGRIVADGQPLKLESEFGGPYRRLLEAERRVRTEIWGAPDWERWTLSRGTLSVEEPRG